MPSLLLQAQPPTDPNWLLSTTAQSAAALVAIIGGLLVSRLVGLAGERESLQRQLERSEAEEQLVAGRLSLIEAQVRSVARGFYIDSNIKRYIDAKGDPDRAAL